MKSDISERLKEVFEDEGDEMRSAEDQARIMDQALSEEEDKAHEQLSREEFASKFERDLARAREKKERAQKRRLQKHEAKCAKNREKRKIKQKQRKASRKKKR